MLTLNTKYEYSIEQEQKIQCLRDKIEKSNDLNVGRDDVFLTKFLFFANWNVEKAFEGIIRYYDFKAENPEWFANHSFEYFREQFVYIKAKFLMPNPDKMGRPIVVFKTVDYFEKYSNYFMDLMEIDDLVFESLLLLPQTQERGVTIIFDLNGISRNFLSVLSPRIGRLVNEKNMIMPFTKRYIHIIQNGLLINAVSSMILPFLSRDFKKNIFIHNGNNLHKLQKMVGYEFLPADYGGLSTNQLDINILFRHLLLHSDYLSKLQAYKKTKRNLKV